MQSEYNRSNFKKKVLLMSTSTSSAPPPWALEPLRSHAVNSVGCSPKELAHRLGVEWTENHDHEDVMLLYFKNQGKKRVHLCPDWDYMAIHDRSPEFEACSCYP